MNDDDDDDNIMLEIPCSIFVTSIDLSGRKNSTVLDYTIAYPKDKGVFLDYDGNLIITNKYLVDMYVMDEIFFGFDIKTNIKTYPMSYGEDTKYKISNIEIGISESVYKVFTRKNKIRNLLEINTCK